MTELETMQRAKMYIDKLAKGVNPLDDSQIPDDDIINNIRLSRCLFYVSDVLRQVIENGGVSPKRNRKQDFNISFEQIQKFPVSNERITVSKMAEKINSLVDTANMKKLTHRNISDWLVSIGMLQAEVTSDGRNTKRPTSDGREIGITTEDRVGQNGVYTVVLYNREAQQFIIDNFDGVLDTIKKKSEKPGDAAVNENE